MDLINEKLGDFLQSEEWRKFQESVGRKSFHLENESFWANIIKHKLPIVGSYFYIPRGPVMEHKTLNMKHNNFFNDLIELAKKENAGWIRFDPENEEILNLIKKNTAFKIKKAPHDMQPRENFVIDISKSEEELLLGMKSKTRYNINLAKKKGVKIFTWNMENGTWNKNDCINEFIRLVKATAERKNIKFHPENYYRKMIETIPENILKLYVAEYNNKIIAANLVAFYGKTAIYLHGATDDEYRNVMAPYFLQWQSILDAKEAGCEKYDFGGVKTFQSKGNGWEGITKFKLGFSLNTEPKEFPGSYDIIINKKKHILYSLIANFKKIIS